jgi:hypothetical protein
MTLQYNILRRFLGLCTYYWMFMAEFANITKPLTQLIEEKWTFQWFLKELGMGPIPGYTRPGENFIVNIEASNVGSGGVLSQVQKGQEHVINTAGRSSWMLTI